MAEWTRFGTNVLIGGGSGVADQLLQNQDDKRAAARQAAGQKLGIMSQYGTLLNYVTPILGIGAIAMGWLKGDWATRVAVAGSQLAGRKGTWQMTKRKETPGYAFTGWHRNPALEQQRQQQLEAARQAALAAAREAAGYNNISPGDQLLT